MNIAIIDDESGSRNVLIKMIGQLNINATSICEYDSVESAISGIQNNKPDIVLLDINLGDGSGFDILDYFSNRDFKVIFITGYDEFAIKAFKYSAMDYLLKPINLSELKAAFDKIENSTNQGLQISTLRDNLSDNPPDSIIIPVLNGFEVIKLTEIIKIDASGSYSTIYSLNQKPKVVSKNLKYYEQLLPLNLFYRVHHGSLVNINYIKQYHHGSGGNLDLADNLKQAVSARKKLDFLAFFKKYMKK